MEKMVFKELVGKTIQRAVLGSAPTNRYGGPGTRITFITIKRDYVYDAYADCCSESWVESTDPLEELVGATVARIEESPTQEVEGTRQDVDQIDFITIVTDKGYWKLEFRNSSNGYYGGCMELVTTEREIAITIPDLREWAKAKDPTVSIGISRDSNQCPVACYLKEHGATAVEVGPNVIEYREENKFGAMAHELITPSDISGVIQAVDSVHAEEGPITAEVFLALLDAEEQ